VNEELQRLMDEYRAAAERHERAEISLRTAHDESLAGWKAMKTAEDSLLRFIEANPPALGPYPEDEVTF
jgi:hypothetical protein